MIIRDLPSENTLYLSSKEQIGKARRLMNNYKILDLPLIEDGIVKGYVCYEDIKKLKDTDSLHSINFLKSNGISVLEQSHIISCLRFLVKEQLTTCAVFNEARDYVGTIIDRDLFKHIGDIYQFSDRGSILVLALDKNQFLISDVLRILETEGGFPVMVFSNTTKKQDEIHLTIKLQIFDNQNIISSLKRYGIEVLYSMEVPDYADFLSDRYDQLIKYLDI